MKCGRFIRGETKVDRQVLRSGQRLAKPSCSLLTARGKYQALRGDWPGSAWSPGNWDAYAELAGSRPLTLMTGERGEKGCTYAAAVRAGSELGQTGVCRWDRLQDLTIRCEEKQQEKQGQGWPIRPKTKPLSLVPAPCKTHEPHILLLSSYLCHSEKYGSHVRGIWIPSGPGL